MSETIEKVIQPLSTAELVEFIQGMQSMPCVWCGKNSRYVHVNSHDETNPLHLRGLPTMTLQAKPNSSTSFLASVLLGTESTLPIILMECTHCGHLSSFNYYSILRRVKKLGGDNG